MAAQTPKPKGKHGKIAAFAGQIVGALYVMPWDAIVGPQTAATWAPMFVNEQVKGLLFGFVSWFVYELWEIFREK